MASIFGHGLLAYTTSKILTYNSSKLLIILAITSAIIPDLDVITFGKIPYESVFGNRGFTHSIVFAILWSLILSLAFGKDKKPLFFIVLLIATLSHGILDALTTGGRGVGFFIPFENSRHFLPWRFIQVSPIGLKAFFSEWGLQVIYRELKYITLPCVIILITLHFTKKEKS